MSGLRMERGATTGKGNGGDQPVSKAAFKDSADVANKGDGVYAGEYSYGGGGGVAERNWKELRIVCLWIS
ncbi:MAG: hypothetical protein LBE13_07040 [Bacteroidales bacterium]|jgi:hypothetical protein|nr:hypothetical protein [Bacteroidales bacterium]